MGSNDPTPPAPRRPRFVYVPALGPGLRTLLFVIFAGVALLGATGGYLLAIRITEWVRAEFLDRTGTLQTQFSLWMVLVHIVAGLLLIVPFLVFGLYHLVTAWNRPNRVAVRLGIVVLALGIVVGVTGLLLIQLDGMPQLTTGTLTHTAILALHAIVPVAAVAAYVLHRRAGPAIQWRWGYYWGGAVAAFTVVMIAMHAQNPRAWFAKGSPEGEKYFEPSRTRTVDGKFIAAETLMMDEYCMKCHPDVYNSHVHSAHRLSSFNNPAYLFSVRETRKSAGIRASRWCAGCHDPVPFFSGQFDDPHFDDVNNPTAHAGITCTVCHAMTHVNSRSGNADYTITEPEHYPFAYSDNPLLQWVNNQLVKAKPDLHKKTFLKTFHKGEAFCSTCHKVGLPQEVNHYKEFLRGQDHADSFLLSGVSGHGARSFYYPPKSKRCNECHMPLKPSDDFAARDFDGSGTRKIHDHTFLGGNTGVHALVGHSACAEVIERQAKFLQKGPGGKTPSLRVDLFGLKKLGDGMEEVEAPLVDDQPLRPNLPKLEPGAAYLVETVVRTLGLGHHFTQGTADSNEVWVEFVAREHTPDGTGRLLGKSGGMSGDDEGVVDEWAHFINVLMLDRHGNRIDRRNPQDIFTPLYNHQIPPGAGQVVHYRLDLPKDLKHPVELSVRVRYRKFDHKYMEYVRGKGNVPKLPIVDLASDRVILPVAGVAEKVPEQQSPIKPPWQRWNDYGIGLFLEGGPDGKMGGELGAAEHAFGKLLTDAYKEHPEAKAHGWLNLARVHLAYGGQERLDQARAALIKARESQPPAPWQTVAWFNGLINVQNVNFAEAIEQFEQILDPKNRDPLRGFDFTKDFVVRAELGKTLYSAAQQTDGPERDAYLRRAIAQLEQVLTLDPENVVAHEFLQKAYTRLADVSEARIVPNSLSAGEKRLPEQIELIGKAGTPDERLAAARELSRLLGELEAKDRPSPAVLAQAHHDSMQLLNAAESPLLRLALIPAVTQLDRLLLEAVPGLSATFANAGLSKEQRLAAGQLLIRVLTQLNSKPAQEDAVATLLPLASWPSAGLPVNLALLGVADRGHLQGPLPPPRLLVLYAARPGLHQLHAETADAELRGTAAMALGRMHLVMHGIFKTDDSARDTAVRRYRERHPAAARASQPIVIYEAKK